MVGVQVDLTVTEQFSEVLLNELLQVYARHGQFSLWHCELQGYKRTVVGAIITERWGKRRRGSRRG